MKLAGYQVSRGNWYIEMSPCMLLSYIIRLSQLHTSAKPCHFSFSNTHQLIIWSKYLLQVTVVVSVVLLSDLGTGLGKTGFTRVNLLWVRPGCVSNTLYFLGTVGQPGFFGFCVQNTSVHPLGNHPARFKLGAYPPG